MAVVDAAGRSWTEIYDTLTRADRAEDLERLATAAYMLGRDEEYCSALERAYHAHLERGGGLPAARCAFWLGLNLMLRGETGRATGWMGRAQRLVEREESECVEQGYLMLPAMFRHEAAGELEAAAATAGAAGAIGERFGDADLFALCAQARGTYLVMLGRPEDGLALLDEAMVAVTAGELSPIASGLVYCGVILGCQAAYEPRRAHEWTAALTQWCERQPDMVAFTGRCLIHRAEIMCLHGAWEDALQEAQRAARRCEEGGNRVAGGEAVYLQGEVHRLRGELASAEAAYREASQAGREPQPGLALLRLAQGDGAAAAAAIRRALGEAVDAPGRARLLPAYVEVLLAQGETEEARALRSSSERSRRASRTGCWARWPPSPPAPSRWPPATPARRWARRGAPPGCGSGSRRRTRRRAHVRWSGWPAARSATRTPPRSSSRPPAGSSRGSAHCRTSRAPRRSRRRRRPSSMG